MSGTEQRRWLLDVQYDCRDCEWPPGPGGGKNGVGLAAQHAQQTGHNTVAEAYWHREWNGSDPEAADQ